MAGASAGLFDGMVVEYLLSDDYSVFLDVGCGQGRYVDLIRACYASATVLGVEIDADYVKRFDLQARYDRLYVESVIGFFDLSTE